MSILASRMEDYMEICSHCGLEEKCKTRLFSDKGKAALVAWHEADARTLEKPLCTECYSEFRSVLADRADEI